MRSMFYQLKVAKQLNAIEPFYLQETNEIMTGLKIWVLFDPVFLGNKYLKSNQFNKKIKIGRDDYYLSDLVQICYDNQLKENGLYFEAHPFIDLHYSIIGFSKDVQISPNIKRSESIPIESDEFYFLIERYGQLFESSDFLKPSAYDYEEVHFFKDYDSLEVNKLYFGFYENVLQASMFQNDGSDGVAWEIHNNGMSWDEYDQFLPADKPLEKERLKKEPFVWWH